MSLSQKANDNLPCFDPLEVVHADFYNDLRKLAARQMLRLHHLQTLQPTALVHEVWIRLARQGRKWKDRDHFLASASLAMRHILIENARKKSSIRHGGGFSRLSWESLLNLPVPDRADIILLIDEGICELEQKDPDLALVVVERFFGGKTNTEIADSLGIGQRSVERRWAMAKVWLLRWIQQSIQSNAAQPSGNNHEPDSAG